MNIYEIQEHAKYNGDGIRFKMMDGFGEVWYGHFVDAWFGMIRIPYLGNGFISLSSLIQDFGADTFTFEVMED